MFSEQTCIVLSCDDCKKPLGDEDGGSWHFDDRDQAIKTAIDCEWLGLGEIARCRDCLAVRACAADGHEWSDWYACLCGGTIKGHDGGTTGEHRYCSRCNESDRRERAGTCEKREPLPPQSAGAVLVQHRRNHQLWVAARPADASRTHDVPAAVEDLVAQGAEIAARIDAVLADVVTDDEAAE